MTDVEPGDPYAEAAVPLRARLVRRVVTAGGLGDPGWRAAFAEVPRHVFVPVYYRPRPAGGGFSRFSADAPDSRARASWLAGAYADAPLITHIRGGELLSSSSQPSLMAAMLEALQVLEGHTVLEIGAGTGFNAALLAHRLGGEAVTSVDLETAITQAARSHLAATGFAAVAVVTGDGSLGWARGAPYDRIIATCELPFVPPEWLRQCRPGGLVLAPFGGGLIALRVTGAHHAQGRFLPAPAYFVSLRGAGAAAHPAPEAIGPEERVRSTTTPPQVLDSELFRFLLTLLAGELQTRWAFGGRGAAITAPDGSAARADRSGTVLLAGPRDLWALVEEAHALFDCEGHPSRDRFGMTIHGDHQWTWLDHPDGPNAWELPRV
ncbi:methyltransferase domain-containing protein [Actinacidiphila soli]|uniref:methyltransferase domain-containing protein n=1 Tax=Actinacidiphila soli TaxID=2487275 RepID=UPI000FCA388C|nr:methyltransferase domain-containing protein [Actinacidiphila soli]